MAESVLSGVQQALYEELKSKITTVASKGGSTKFSISADLGLTWQTTARGKALDKEVSSHFDALNTSKIIDCMKRRHPPHGNMDTRRLQQETKQL